LDFHKVGLIIGLIVFVALIFTPHPLSMDRSGYTELTSRLPDATPERIEQEFGPVNEDNFREFLEYAKTVRIATGSSSTRFITGEAYNALDDTSSFNSPQTLYELIKGQGRAQMRVLALALLMAIWWITEAVPVPLTALLPMVLLPVMRVCNYRYAVYPGYFSAFEQYAHYLSSSSSAVSSSLPPCGGGGSTSAYRSPSLASSAPNHRASYSGSWSRRRSYPCGYRTRRRQPS
jgi:hypothetical protein